jgi:hypothetical protein
VCLPAAKYQWGFSSVLLFLFCCITICFAAVLFSLEWDIWSHSQTARYATRSNGYQEAVYIVHALEEAFGEDKMAQDPGVLYREIKPWTGSINIDTHDMPMARRNRQPSSLSMLSGRLRRSRGGDQRLPDIPLLDQQAIATRHSDSMTTR